MVAASVTNSYAKEMAIRKRIANIYNKREEDFPSLREYNDYLEEVEDMIFSLVEGIKVPSIEAQISKYQEENAEQIINSRARKAEELAAALKACKGPQPRSDGIDGMEGSTSQLGSNAVAQGQYAPALMPGAAFGQPRPTALQPIPLGSGVDVYSAEDEETLKIRIQKGERAGGWTLELSKRRAYEEAFGSIF